MNQGLFGRSHTERICLKVISVFYVRAALHMLAWTYFTERKYKCHPHYAGLAQLFMYCKALFFLIQLTICVSCALSSKAFKAQNIDLIVWINRLMQTYTHIPFNVYSKASIIQFDCNKINQIVA